MLRENGRRTKFIPAVIAILILASVQWGCDLAKLLLGSPEEQAHAQELLFGSIASMMNDVDKMLRERGVVGLSPDAVASLASTVTKMANDAVALTNYAPTDLEHLIPVAAGAAVEGLGKLQTILSDDDKRTASVDAIVGAFVRCMNGRFEATKNLRVLSPSAQVVSAIIANISKAAVTNLAKAGYTSNTGLTGAASGVVTSIIGSLGDSGVNKILVNTVVGSVTKSAVESLQATGLTNAEAIATAVESVTKGAVSAITTLSVGGVGSSDYPSLAAEISKSASAALGALSTDTAAAIPLVVAVATGAAEGVKAVASTPNLDSAVVLSMVQQATAGTTLGVISNTFATSGNSTTLIQTVTSNLSQELLTGTTQIQQSDVLAQVTQGAAAAAQNIPTGVLDATALTTAITLTLANGTQVAPSTTDIATGITLGKNTPPVANAGPDQSVDAGATVTLDATGSTDADTGDTLSYAWKLAGKPSTSTSAIAEAVSTTVNPTFVPDVPGTYIVSLKVTDGKAVTEAFCTITVLAPATSATYLGKTAAERLATADTAMAALEHPTARNELLTILLYYPETALFPEVTYKLARCYKSLENYDLALGRFQEVVNKYPTTIYEVWARLHIGDIKTWNIVDYAGAGAQYQNLSARNLQTAEGATTITGSGWLELAQGNYLQARSLFAQARDLSYADLFVRFYSQLGYAESYKRNGEYAAAETEFQRLLNETRFSQADPLNSATFDPLYIFKARINLNWLYGAWGTSKKAERIAILEANRDDSRLLGWQRLNSCRILAERYLWDFEATSTNYQLSLDTLTAALIAYSGTDVDTQRELAWAGLRKGQAYAKLGDTAAVSTAKDTYYTNAIQAFNDLNTTYGSAYFGVRPAGEGAIEKANLYAWGKNDYTTAISIAQQVVGSYPADANQYPRAFAYFSLGQYYRDLGWKQKNTYGQNYLDKFQTALNNYSYVRPETFPLIDRTTWFFIQVPRWIGECYSGMDNYPLARSYFTSVLSSASFSTKDKAWVQLSLAKSYGEEVRQLLTAGNYTAAQDLGNNYAEPAFLAVGNYKNADTTFVSNGEPMATAYFELGRVLKDSAESARNAGAQTADWQALFSRAIPVLTNVTWSNFPNLDPTLWFFYESLAMQAHCMEMVGDYTSARTNYTTILNGIASHYIPDSEQPDVQRRLARNYRSEGQSLNDKTLLLSAMTEFQNVIALGTSLDGGAAAAWSFPEMGWTYNNLLHLTDWGSAVPSEMLGYYNAAASVAAQAAAWRGSNGLLVDNGQPTAGAQLSCGTVLNDYAYYYRDWVVAGVPDANFVAYLRAAVALFQAASDTTTYPGAWIDDVMGARVNLINTWIELAAAPGEDIGADFQNAETITASILVDPKATAKYIGQAAATLGWGYINRGMGLVAAGTHPIIQNEQAWLDAAAFYFNMIVGPGHDAKFDTIPSGIIQNCVNGLTWLATYTPPTSVRTVMRTVKRTVSVAQKTPVFRFVVHDRPFYVPDPTRR